MIICRICLSFLYNENEYQPQKNRGILIHQMGKHENDEVWCDYCYQDEMAIVFGISNICTTALTLSQRNVGIHTLCESPNCECECHTFVNQLEVLLL